MYQFQNVIVAPQRWLDPAHKEHRTGLSDYEKGGKYLEAVSKTDLTGTWVERAVICAAGAQPTFEVTTSTIPALDRFWGKVIRTNLFKKSAGWRWETVLEPFGELRTLVSVETGGKHHYAVTVEFHGGVQLARYPEAKSEPRLRPTTYGSLEFNSSLAGYIVARGKKHPVYTVIEVRR